MLDMFLNETTWWLFGTAVLFTFVGRYTAFRSKLEGVVEATIDSLIEDGYIKTKGSGETLELLKHWEYDEEKSKESTR